MELCKDDLIVLLGVELLKMKHNHALAVLQAYSTPALAIGASDVRQNAINEARKVEDELEKILNSMK